MERLSPARARVRARSEGAAVPEKFLLFRVGDGIYGMGLRSLREVLLSEGLTPLPTPPYQICDALAHRGFRLPVIRMWSLFDVPQTIHPATARVLLTQGQGRSFGLLVDEVVEMADLNPAHIVAVPRLATLLPPTVFRGLFAHRRGIVLLADERGLAGLDEVVRFYAEDAPAVPDRSGQMPG